MSAPPLNNPKLFISYATEDRAVVELVERHLRKAGIEVWRDITELKQGDIFQVEINASLNECSHFLLICSAASGVSERVKAELLAIEHRLKRSSSDSPVIIPLFLPGSFDTDQPEFIRKSQGLKLPESPNDYDVFFQRLLAAILLSSAAPIPDISEVDVNASNQSQNNTKQPLRIIKTLRLPDINWIEIPAGSFIYGKDLIAPKTLTLQRYYISKYPITNSQFQTFIDAGGYQDERWWLDLTIPEPAKPRWTQTNRPRESINWYEAVAYTRWLSVQLSYEITLPTEQQWEKAARGSDGRQYPWGNEFKSGDANVYDESSDENLQQTTAVGLFPHRSSPYEVMDMAGNVWEWCLNKFDNPESIAIDRSNQPRALRGGYWNLNPLSARTSERRGREPDLRDYDAGFRVVRSSPFAEASKPE